MTKLLGRTFLALGMIALTFVATYEANRVSHIFGVLVAAVILLLAAASLLGQGMQKPKGDVDEKRLRGTTNAMVWAEEFKKVCPTVDDGLMIEWFANAIETGRQAARTGTMSMSEIRSAITQAVGAASVCWTPRPSTEVFDSEMAIKISESLFRTVMYGSPFEI